MDSKAIVLTCAALMLAVSGELLAEPEAEPSQLNLDERTTCAQMCLYTIARLNDISADFTRVKELLGPGQKGLHSLHELRNAAGILTLSPLILKTDAKSLRNLPLPAIAHVKMSFSADDVATPHYLVILRTTDEGVYFLDPPYPPGIVSWASFQRAWSGYLVVFPRTAEQRNSLLSQLRRDWLRWPMLLVSACGVACILAVIVGGYLKRWAFHLRKQLLVLVSLARLRRKWSRTNRVMPWLPLFGLAFILMVAVGIGIWLVTLGAVPRLEIPKDSFDLGSLPEGNHDAIIPIHNAGKASLIVTQVKTSCSCLITEAPRAILPGRWGQLSLSLAVSSGPGNANVFVWSNDPNGIRRIRVVWHGSCARLRLLPRAIRATNVAQDRPYQRTVRVMFPGGERANLPRFISADCENPNVTVALQRTDPIAYQTRSSRGITILGYMYLDISVQPLSAKGAVKTTSRVHVEYDGALQVLELPISVEFARARFVDHQEIVFSATQPQSILQQKRTVRIDCDAVSQGQLVEIARRPDWLTCQISPSSSEQYVLEATVSAIPEGTFSRGTILIRLGVVPVKELPVDVIALVTNSD